MKEDPQVAAHCRKLGPRKLGRGTCSASRAAHQAVVPGSRAATPGYGPSKAGSTARPGRLSTTGAIYPATRQRNGWLVLEANTRTIQARLDGLGRSPLSDVYAVLVLHGAEWHHSVQLHVPHYHAAAAAVLAPAQPSGDAVTRNTPTFPEQLPLREQAGARRRRGHCLAEPK